MPDRSTSTFHVPVLAAVTTLLALVACGPADPGPAVDPADGIDGEELAHELVGDDRVFPGGDAGLVGAIAGTQGRADELWAATGFSGEPPTLTGDETLLIVTGGESGTCPFEPTAVTYDEAAATVGIDLGHHRGVCTDDWNPRALALLVAGPEIDEDTTLEVAYRGIVHTAEPMDPDEVAAAFQGDTEPVAAEPTDLDGVALLRSVRVEAFPGWHPASGHDRVTFVFEDDRVPGYDVAYAEPPFHREPSGELVEVPGEVFLEVRLEPASGHVEDREPAYEGPDRVTARTPAETEAILEATLVSDHQGAMTWIVGVTDEQRPFRIDADAETGVVRVEVAWQPSPTP